MYRYKKIMVHLNLDEHDESLIRYAGMVSRMAESHEVCFVHVADTFHIPDEIKKIYPELSSPADEAAETRMKKMVSQHFTGDSKTQIAFRALEGSVLGVLISSSKKADIDLLIVGESPDKTSSLSLPEKLARKAFCSVLILPRNRQVVLKKVLVAVDFSDHCLNALDVGSAFAKAAGLKHIYILNTYRIPSGYYKTGKSYEEFAEIMLENAKSRLKQLLPRADLKSIGIKPFFKKNDNAVEGILRFSDEINADLIVVGARGRSGEIAAVLLGSITEGLIRDLKRPLLAVKEKGEGLNILEALSSE